jgi:hypothetical protein
MKEMVACGEDRVMPNFISSQTDGAYFFPFNFLLDIFKFVKFALFFLNLIVNDWVLIIIRLNQRYSSHIFFSLLINSPLYLEASES